MKFQNIRRKPPTLPKVAADAAVAVVCILVFCGLLATGILYLNLFTH